MIEKNYDGNLFLLPGPLEAGAVTTNGIVKSNGEAVMGAGIAKYARDHFNGIARRLGEKLKSGGNHAYFMGPQSDRSRAAARLDPEILVVTLPTKNNWRDDSDLDLIAQSCRELMAIADQNGLRKIYLPMPGCTNGRLDYISQVRPVIAGILDNRFVVCLPWHVYGKLHG